MKMAPFVLLLLTGFAAADDVRFESVDVFLTSDEPVAAWQFELTEARATMQVVGVENGESDVFGDAPYYDREAVRTGIADRIIVADYSTAPTDELPSGRIRIATLHLMLSGAAPPEFDLELTTAVRVDGTAVDAAISLEASAGSEQ